MPSRRRRFTDSSSSENSPPSHSVSRRRLPSPPPIGILRNSRHVTIMDPKSITRRVERIADNLEDTSRNLENVDTRLSDYKDLHTDSMSALSKLKNDLEGSISKLRSEREKRTAARESRSLHQSDFGGQNSARRPASSLGFDRAYRQSSGDHLNDSVHDLRGRVANLTENQAKLEQELSFRSDLKRPLKEVNGSLRGLSAADRVEHRLKQLENEMKSERDAAARYANDSMQNLVRKSQAKVQDEDSSLRSQLLQADAGKRSLESDVKTLKRRLEQSEGGREALSSQIADLRNEISKSEKDKAELEKGVREQIATQQALRDREAEEKRQLASSQRYDFERRKQEDEINDLRAALKQSVGVVQLDEMRKKLEKSERQRQQLSDHIEVLTSDLEKKEQSQARLLNQLHETQHSSQDAGRERDRLSMQLEEALLKLQHYGSDTEKSKAELRQVERIRDDMEKEKDDLRLTLLDTIRQWKSKCKKLEKDNERLQDNLEQLMAKNEELVKENQTSKSQANKTFQQVENLRRELEDLISKRVDAEERLRRRDIESSKSEEEIRELERKLQHSMQGVEKLEDELKQKSDRIVILIEDQRRSDDENTATQSLLEATKLQCLELQKQVRDLAVSKSDVVAQLDVENTNKKTVQKRLEESDKQLESMRFELSALHKQINLERDTHKKELSKLHSNIRKSEAMNVENMQKLSRQVSEERDFMEREIHRINVEANESKAAKRAAEGKMLLMQEQLSEALKLNISMKAELEALREKYVLAKSYAEEKKQDAAKGNAKLHLQEDDLILAQDKTRKLEQDLELIKGAILQDIDELSSVLHLDDTAVLIKSNHSMNDSITATNNIHTWLSSIRHKIGIIKREIYETKNKKEKLAEKLNTSQIQLKDVCRTMEEDRRMLMSEATEQNKLVDVLSREKTSLLLENKEARRIVQELEDRVMNLTSDLESSKARLQHSLLHEIPVKLSATQDSEDSTKKRERIHLRYARYKETIQSLQNDLIDVRHPDRLNDADKLLSDSTPSPIRRVTISETPPRVHGYQSCSRPMSSSPKYVAERDKK